MTSVRAATLVLCVFMGQAEGSGEGVPLLHESDPAHLEAAAVAIAAAGKASDLAVLADRLGQPSFLARLDPQSGPEVAVVHLANVFRALAEHPSAATAELCLALGRNPRFTAVPARVNLLLNALAAERPMSQAAADYFRATNSAGFVEVNGPLLARNGSAAALEVLAQMLSDDKVDVAQRVSIAHWSLLPTRANLGIVEMCTRVLQNDALAHDVRIAMLESLYDYQPRRWFGLAAGQPGIPTWTAASRATLAALQSLGKHTLNRSDLPVELRAAIVKTLTELP